MKSFLKYLKRISLLLLLLITILVSCYYQKDIPVNTLIKKYCNKESRFIPLMGMQMHYRDEGNSLDSIPIVFIHGTASSYSKRKCRCRICRDYKRDALREFRSK